MLILGIDTTEKNINVALTENNVLLSEIEEINPKNEDIILLIDKLFKECSKRPDDLKGVGVITGPGGYTGTRAGVSVAKTMSQFLNIPIVGFTKPEAIILSYHPSDNLICPMIDIRRNEVYSCIAKNNNSNIKYIIEPQVINVNDWSEKLKSIEEKLTVLTYEFKETELFSKEKLGNSDNIIIDDTFYLKPLHIAMLAQKFIENGNAKSFNEVSPFYVREAI